MTTLTADFTFESIAALAKSDVARALLEDVSTGDLTASLIDPTKRTTARILAREPAVICGSAWAEAAILGLDPSAKLTWTVKEGERCQADQTVLEIEGLAAKLLTAERTALNFLQMMSAVATKTAVYVDIVKGTKAKIVDTRKTLPGLRMAQKYAVLCGGGTNHRIGLYDAVLIKENHIAAAGSIPAVLERAAKLAPNAKFIEIEVETLVLLDNMSVPTLHEAVKINQGRAVLEISGGVTLNGLRELAETGVDRISIGTLTKDVKATDFSMRFGGFVSAFFRKL
jgi:nicotinate-nucleotide pyrophosphorylase (carboxylating)